MRRLLSLQGGGLTFGYFTRPSPPPALSLITGGAIISAPLIQQTPAVAAPFAVVRLGSFVGAVLPKLTLQVARGPDFAKVKAVADFMSCLLGLRR